MTTSLIPQAVVQFFSNSGAPLSGGKLYSYAAGTSTPLATYTDSTGNTANTNPVILNTRGEANVWFSSAAYKLTLKDSTDAQIWSVDNLNGPDQATLAALAASGGSALVGFIQAGTGAVARTAQSKMRDIINVKDYGAVGDHVQGITQGTDDTAAIQAAINYAKSQNHGTVYFPNASGYRVTAALNVTGTSGIQFLGESGNNSSYATIYPEHTGHVFDCSDSSFLSFSEISVRPVTAATKPATAWFFARNSAADSAGNHYLQRCTTFGSFASAAVYSYASESNEYYDCYLSNNTAASKAVVITGYNILGLSSSFITIATGGRSNIIANFWGGSIAIFSTGNSDALYLEAASCINVNGTELFSSSGTVGGRSLIYIDSTNSAAAYLNINNINGENYGGAANPTYALYMAGAAATIHTGFNFSNWRIASNTNLIYGTNDIKISGAYFSQINNVGAGATSSIYDMEYATVLGGTWTLRYRCLYSNFASAASAITLPATYSLRAGTVVNDLLTGSFDYLRGGSLTVPTNPADVSVPNNTATTLFDIRSYLGGGQMTEFTVFDSATILATGRINRNSAGTFAVALLDPTQGAGAAFSISGNNLQFLHTTGGSVTVSTRVRPPSSAAI
jgi:hypothetical protein